MDTIATIRARAAQHKKVIALPEFTDKRVKEAAVFLEAEGIVKPLLLTPETIDPARKQRYIEEFYEMRKAKGLDRATAEIFFSDPLYYAAMMAREGAIAGFVAGAAHTTSDVGRASILCLGVEKRFSVACSCFIMVVPQCPYGAGGTFVYADCGLIQDPTSEQLACVAVQAAELMEKVVGVPAKVALLSYSTKGSAKGLTIDKVAAALPLIRKMAPALIVDGELQVDAAIVPEVAGIKYPTSPVRGEANVLIFPDLDAGNIGYKLTQRMANARAVGPLILGLNKPCSDLSRGCSVEDIVDCAAVTALRAQ